MSLYTEIPCSEEGQGQGWGSMYGEVQYIIDNCHMNRSPPVDKKTDTTENITFPQLLWRAVITRPRSFLVVP